MESVGSYTQMSRGEQFRRVPQTELLLLSYNGQGDEFDDFIDKLEADDYELAYTKEAVQKAKEEYEYLSAHQLVEAIK